jgi:hypothetical protein
MAALNLAPQSWHSNMPTDNLDSSPALVDPLEGMGQVLTGVVTSASHFGHLTNLSPIITIILRIEMSFAAGADGGANY